LGGRPILYEGSDAQEGIVMDDAPRARRIIAVVFVLIFVVALGEAVWVLSR
jgi:hypothetical protein